jgi:hypothetical protein
MHKFIILLCLSMSFSNCKHYSLEQQTIEALHGKWEVYEVRAIDAQTNSVKIRTDQLSMFLLSPWYGGDSGVNFVNNTEVVGKLGTDWTRFNQTTYTFQTPNKLTFTLHWVESQNQHSAEIVKLDANELWLKRTNPFPYFADEVRLKKVR